MYIGVDIGGMSLKAGLVDEYGSILHKTVAVTAPDKSPEEITEDIARLIERLAEECRIKPNGTDGIGLGFPGSVDADNGVVRYCCNINMRRTPVAGILKARLGAEKVYLGNDANCAALGETLFGAGGGARDSVMVTLGTGVGTGIVCGGRLMTGHMSAGAEGGHMQISMGGPVCGCGKRGHYEAYASATALIRQTEAAVRKHPESLLAEIAAKNGIDGKTAFTAAKAGDKTAVGVVGKYIEYVGMGLVSLANLFWPEVFIIGGGISKEGAALTEPLERYLAARVYGGEYNPPVRVVAAKLGNDAGIIGAAALAMNFRP